MYMKLLLFYLSSWTTDQSINRLQKFLKFFSRKLDISMECFFGWANGHEMSFLWVNWGWLSRNLFTRNVFFPIWKWNDLEIIFREMIFVGLELKIESVKFLETIHRIRNEFSRNNLVILSWNPETRSLFRTGWLSTQFLWWCLCLSNSCQQI